MNMMEWVICPICNYKTRIKIRKDRQLKNFKLIPYDQYSEELEKSHYHYKNGFTKKWIQKTYQKLIPNSLENHELNK